MGSGVSPAYSSTRMILPCPSKASTCSTVVFPEPLWPRSKVKKGPKWKVCGLLRRNGPIPAICTLRTLNIFFRPFQVAFGYLRQGPADPFDQKPEAALPYEIPQEEQGQKLQGDQQDE